MCGFSVCICVLAVEVPHLPRGQEREDGWVGGRFKRPLGVSSHYLSKERLLPERNSEARISFRSLVPRVALSDLYRLFLIRGNTCRMRGTLIMDKTVH